MLRAHIGVTQFSCGCAGLFNGKFCPLCEFLVTFQAAIYPLMMYINYAPNPPPIQPKGVTGFKKLSPDTPGFISKF
jgi:hypothetical protein